MTSGKIKLVCYRTLECVTDASFLIPLCPIAVYAFFFLFLFNNDGIEGTNSLEVFLFLVPD